jgi:hypothetical protein
MLKKAVAIITLLVLVGGLANVGRGEDVKPEPARPSGVTIYDADPQHLWNRLHHALYVRTDADGQELGADRLDPLLWDDTRHLLSGKSHEAAVAVLDEFLSRHGEQLFSDPLRRAILQRDLWAVFDWAAARLGTVEQSDERNRLLVRLAIAIDRVALTKDQIQNLPDNLAAAVASKSFAAGYDSDHPQAEFLPPDLLNADGPWVCLEADGGKTITPQHDDAFGGRSVFLVLLRLPAGRQATLGYLTKLRRFKNPWTFDPKDVNSRLHPNEGGPPVLSAELPQFPEGTQVALVRRAIFIDTQGNIVPSRLVESIQLRHFRKVPGQQDAHARDEQDVHELQLSRKRLFAGEAGGLFSPDTDFLSVQFRGFGIDEFERTELHEAQRLQRSVRGSCFTCHSAVGIFSVQSLRASFAERGYGRMKLAQRQLDDATNHAVYRKLAQRSWGLLQGLRIAARANPQAAAP